MSSNSTFYFQSNRRRGRSGDWDDGRPARSDAQALMSRLAALDERVGALMRGEGRIPGSLAESLTALQGELGGLAVALKELALLKEGQESVQRENEALRAEIAALREVFITNQEALQETAARIAQRLDRGGGTLIEGATAPGEIIIEPIRPRLLLQEAEAEGPEAVLRLDADQ